MASGLERVAIGLMALSMRLDTIAIRRRLAQDAKWDESKHPRKENGEFGKNGTKGDFGTKVNVYKEDIKRYNDVLYGAETKIGIPVKAVSGHAVGRLMERGISPDTVKKNLFEEDTKVSPGHTQQTVCFEQRNIRIVFDKVTGTVVTVMFTGKRRRERGR